MTDQMMAFLWGLCIANSLLAMILLALRLFEHADRIVDKRRRGRKDQ